MKFLKYLPHIAFMLALSYFGMLAFLMEKDPMLNKMIMIMIGGFWVLWIFAKSFIKIMAAVALLGAIAYAGYYVMNAEKIECKKAGREWNETLQVCQDKKTVTEKVKDVVSGAKKTILRKFKKSKSETTEENKSE